jgi:hypothetical protein
MLPSITRDRASTSQGIAANKIIASNNVVRTEANFILLQLKLSAAMLADNMATACRGHPEYH